MKRFTFKIVVDSEHPKDELIQAIGDWAIDGDDTLISTEVLSEKETPEPENEENEDETDA